MYSASDSKEVQDASNLLGEQHPTQGNDSEVI